MRRKALLRISALVWCVAAGAALAQVAPSSNEIAAYTGLFAAAARGDAAEIGRLAAGGADVNAREGYGRTPLHVATLDHVNNLGWSALIESIVLGQGRPRHVATLTALVRAGANVNLADRTGQTPLLLARQRRYQAMVAIFEQAGAK